MYNYTYRNVYTLEYLKKIGERRKSLCVYYIIYRVLESDDDVTKQYSATTRH